MASALSNRQIMRAALVVVLGFLASGVLGLVRTAVFSSTFGTGDALDSFYAAQRIPEILFVLVAGGALGSSFIPVFARFSTNDDEAGAWRLASAVMTCVALLATLLSLILALLAPIIVPALLVPGRPPELQALTTALTQWMLVTVIIFSVSGLLMGILNARNLFVLPALALSMNNLGQIFGALFLTPLFANSLADTMPPDTAGTYGLAVGAILGAVLHLVIQLPGLPRIGARLRFLPDPRIPGVRDVLVLMLPRVLGLAVVQINFLVNVNLASGMVSGSQTALTTAWVLMFFVLGVIAQSMGTALFPSLSALAAQNDMDGFKDRLANALRGVLFLAFPATVGLILLGQPAISVLFERGEWTAQSTAATAWALSFFALGIAGHALLEVLSRAFYALEDTKTPVLIGVASMVANIFLSFLFIGYIDPSRSFGSWDSLTYGPFGGLALANSVTTLLEGVILWLLLRGRIGSVKDRFVLYGVVRSLVAALIMGVVVFFLDWRLWRLLYEQFPLIRVIGAALTGVATYLVLAVLLGIGEVYTIPKMLLRRVRR
jgi:putative peptidoglycan lipid II flippase